MARLSKVGLLPSPEPHDFLGRATKGRWSPARSSRRSYDWSSREDRRSLQSRLQRAASDASSPSPTFDWNWPKKIERDLIERALTSTSSARVATSPHRHERPGQDHDRKEHRPSGDPRRISVLCTTAAELIETCARAARKLCADASAATRGPTCSPSTRSATRLRLARRRPALQGRRSSLRAPGPRELPSRSILITLTSPSVSGTPSSPTPPRSPPSSTSSPPRDVTLIEGESYRVHESERKLRASQEEAVTTSPGRPM